GILGYDRLAWLTRTVLDEAEEADRIIEQMVATNPRSFRAYLARGRYCQKFRSRDEAAKDIARALALAPDDPDVVLAAADVAKGQNRPEEARNLLARTIAAHPRDARLYMALALVEQTAGRNEQAVLCLRRGLKEVPETEKSGILFVLTDLLIERSEVKEALVLIARLRRGQTDPALLDYQAARIQLQQGQWSSALVILERLGPALVNRPELAARAHLCRGLCYEKLGASDLQLNALRDAVAVDPASPQARLQL